MFERVVATCIDAGLVGGTGFAVASHTRFQRDASLIAADVNKCGSTPPLQCLTFARRLHFSGLDNPARDVELLLELDYTFQLATGWRVQPDFRYNWHPGGNVANPLPPDRAAVENIAACGLRSTLHN